MKQRFSSLDIKVIAKELSQSLVSLRVSNIYDLSSRIFLFKFAKPNHRAQIVVDSGFRCHLTSFARTTAGAPSPFVARLRKFLKTRRVTSVKQVGTDRILELQFSDGQYRLFLEFYAGGNIVLTDGELKILALHRNVNEGAEHERIRQGSDYNITLRQNVGGIPPVTKERLKDGLQKWVERQAAFDAQAQALQKKQAKKKADMLRKALSATFNEYPPILLDHALYSTGMDTTKLPEEALEDNTFLEKTLEALQEAETVVKQIMSTDSSKGYIVGKPNPTQNDTPDQPSTEVDASKDVVYNDFHPFRPKQFEDDTSQAIVEFDGFNKTVDEFFSSIEGQKLESRLAEREANAKRKLDNARQDQEKRIGGLQAVQDLNTRKAQAIEANLERVEEAVAAVNGLIAQGMDWIDIDSLIKQEQLRHNPVAELIKLPLKLNENTATLLLGEWEEDDLVETDEGYHTDSEPSDSEDEDNDEDARKKQKEKTAKAKPDDKRLTIDIDLALSGWANAREYYDQKKTAAVKQEKTVQSSTKALKSAQQKIEADLKKGLKQEKSVLRAVRTPLWFEKFIYFISSDGYLVIGGRDAQQSDTIYKRYLKKGDAYVHADLNGAASVVIKNNAATPDAPIPPSTLAQAGNMSVSTSTAWVSKAVMSAWWAPAEQVTKIAPTGDVLKAGNFHIRGEKQFLPPAQLLLGFAVVWRISDASKARHLKHRVLQAPIEGSTETNDKAEIMPQDDDDDSMDEDADDAESVNEAASTHAEDEADADTHDETGEEHAEGDDDHEEEDSRQAYTNPLQSVSKPGPTIDADGKQMQNLSLSDEHTAADNEDQALVPPPAEESEDLASDAEADTEDHDTTAIPSSTSITSTTPSQPHQSQSTTKPLPQTRGQRAKAKKAAKYAHQDPEDRAAAMALLGSGAGQEKAKAEARAKAEKEAEAERARQRRKEQHLKQQEKARRVEAQRILDAENGLGGDDADGDDADADADGRGEVGVDLDTLVASALPGDEILEAIPVCAPWACMGKYKYKVKLQPGTTKKGKAVREILGRWNVDSLRKGVVDPSAADVERMWPREIELIKGWREEEIFGVLPVGRVRVMMGAGAAGKGGASGKGGKAKGGKGKKGR